MGRVGVDSIEQVWRERFSALREEHQQGRFSLPVCSNCKEWHRP
jgi:hypothetical protein